MVIVKVAVWMLTVTLRILKLVLLPSNMLSQVVLNVRL